jgi:hypothetical protein
MKRIIRRWVARNVQWVADGSGVVVERENGYFLFEMDGTQRILKRPPAYDRTSAVSPTAALLALADTDAVTVLDVGSGNVLQKWKLKFLNGSRRRLGWTRDGKYLLLNDLLGVWVWDVASGKEVFHHLLLDLNLPPPMLSDDPEHPSYGSTNRSLAEYVDSQFSPDGRFVASIYNESDDPRSSGSPSASRVRFYDTASGKLLWDNVLPLMPRSMSFSPDGSRLFLLAGDTDELTLLVYDTSNPQLLTQTPLPIRSLELLQLPNGHTLAGPGWRCLTVFDPPSRSAPVALNGSPNATRLMATPDGQQLIEVGRERTVRIWHKRRELSVLGAFALPEIWGLYIGSVVLLAGIVTIAAKDTARTYGQNLPLALRAAAIIASVMLGVALGEWLAGLAIGDLYQTGFDHTAKYSRFNWAFVLVLFPGVVAMVRLARLGWGQILTALFLGALILGTTAAIITTDLRSGPFPARPLANALHGLPLSITAPTELLILCFALVLAAVEIALLLRPEVRALYQRTRFLEPHEPSSGFPLA